tara:strand:- start:651 stop:1106 length:456 start_codon:yes stop_codon:yes gene_type:complete
MIFISHRGNLEGSKPDLENSPEYIRSALQHGFDVEVDVRLINGKFFLGHDKPQHEVDWKFLTNHSLWCHAKDIASLEAMLSIGAHCFWHQEDFVTLTSRGFIWTFPGVDLTSRSICVLPELFDYKNIDCYGICSDEIKAYKEKNSDKSNSL